ncbi:MULTISPECIES: LysR substrate-binding domain-containing protein [Cyanophyceae]|uniref:LysR family transcriptional regulator n=1 Tax=Cyanophyceae TaxID=3028117 RepID=UPI001687ADE3|nr:MULTISPECIES: LysR substrate-binding domain-containing protein [Cyanophyceae]MBD1918236.1 LysR family transcriptional regulator [Phormidium sp. FACHB-77]MBD2030268.1 LysR family transcriptional regulator [Phormidium sp. FACHB-322]MBD2051360.1 LysR family transcriptional regulator [Leptolyngbya sp. FACHB-60]
MEIYQLKVFLEVARCLSFTEAADTLNLTQPAVSAKIKCLESELETPLFRRLGRRIELTQAGEYLLEEGPGLVDLEGRLVAEIEEIKQGKFSTLKIGCMPDMLSNWLPSVLYKYRRVYPDVQTKCVQFDAIESLYRAIKTGEVDIGISDLSFSTFDEISEVAIGSVHYSLVVSTSHQLAQRPWLSLKELTDQAWVLPPEGVPGRIMLQKRMQELGLNLTNFAHVEIVDAASLMRTYLLQGHYLGFVSDFEFQMECEAGLLRRIPLEEFALGTPLFLMMAKRLGRALGLAGQPAGRNSLGLEPIRQFVAMVQGQPGVNQRHSQGATIPKPLDAPLAASANQTVPRFQAPNFLVRCSSTNGTETINLTIGTQNRTIQTVTAGLIIQRLGLLEHFLPREGRYSGVQYRLQWADYSSGAPIVAGLKAQQIDIGVLGDYPLLLSAAPQDSTALAAGTRLISFVASNLDGTGNDIIVPQHSTLDCIDDLAGRVIAVPFGSAAHSMVMRSLHHRHILDAVTLTSSDSAGPQRSGRSSAPVDGYAYFAPFHEIAKHKGQFRRLLHENLDGLPTFHGVVIRDVLAEQYPEIAVAYLRSLLAAQYWYATQPMATTLVSRWVNMDAAIVTKTLRASTSDRADVVYLPETQLRTDWLQAHIDQLGQIAGQEHLGQINLDRWMQPEFLERAIASI